MSGTNDGNDEFHLDKRPRVANGDAEAGEAYAYVEEEPNNNGVATDGYEQKSPEESKLESLQAELKLVRLMLRGCF